MGSITAINIAQFDLVARAGVVQQARELEFDLWSRDNVHDIGEVG